MQASGNVNCLEKRLLNSNCYNDWIKLYKKSNEYKNNPYIAIKDHINEDTVTDLLAYIIVQYELKKEFVEFLIKQLQKNKKFLNGEEDSIEFETQKIIKSGRIDLFIKFNINKTPSCIIFENKIFDARDQQNQLKKYVDAVYNEDNEVNQDNIFVFYVSSDGNKVPENNTNQPKFHQLGFYRQEETNNTIYSFLVNSKKKNEPLIKYFCNYLKYMFSYSSSVNLFKNVPNIQINEIFSDDPDDNKKFPSITERIYEYTSDKELKRYYLQLCKVHILNKYIQSKLKPKVRYNFVFDGVKKEDTISIDDFNIQPITLETKYYRRNYFMVLTVYFYNNNKNIVRKYISEKLTDRGKMRYFECDDKKKNYSLWLWLPNKLSQLHTKDKFTCYTDYIDKVCECMMELFEAFTGGTPVSIKSFAALYNTYH